jgi:hypothetical protein
MGWTDYLAKIVGSNPYTSQLDDKSKQPDLPGQGASILPMFLDPEPPVKGNGTGLIGKGWFRGISGLQELGIGSKDGSQAEEKAATPLSDAAYNSLSYLNVPAMVKGGFLDPLKRSYDYGVGTSKGAFEGDIKDDSGEKVAYGNPSLDAFMAGSMAPVVGAVGGLASRGTSGAGAFARETPAFADWFDGSKIVDGKGQPLTVYHGTKSAFDKFDMKKAGASDEGLAGKAAYFTYNPEEASGYALNETFGGMGDAPNVIPAHAAIKNPFVITHGVLPDGRTLKDLNGGIGITSEGGSAVRQLAEAGGHDGVVFADRDGSVRHVAAFQPNTVRSATTGETLFSNSKEAAPVGAFAQAGREIDSRGFYSPSLEAAKGLKQQSGTVQQFKSQILKGGGKPKELDALGFDKAFPDPNAKVSRAEIEDFLRANRVELGGTAYGGPSFKERSDAFTKAAQEDGLTVEQYFPFLSDNVARQRPEVLTPRLREMLGTLGKEADDRSVKFESYSTPGGIPGSYREVISTAPHSQAKRLAEIEARVKEVHAQQYDMGYNESSKGIVPDKALSDQLAAEKAALMKEYDQIKSPDYTSSHWPGVTNPVLHYRTKDFPGVEGSKTRVLDEMQSDWAQRARDAGVKDPGIQAAFDAKKAEQEALSKEYGAYAETIEPGWLGATEPPYLKLRRAAEQGDTKAADLEARWDAMTNEVMDLRNKVDAARSGVPSMPWLNTSDWVDLGLKQALMDAAKDSSVNRFAWAPGSTQAQRYGMEHQIRELHYDPTLRRLTARPKDGRRGEVFEDVGPDKLPEIIGREAADKLLAQPLTGDTLGPGQVLSGQDLRMGGEGHKKFYGDMTPEGYQSGILGTRLQKLVKGLDPEATNVEPVLPGVDLVENGPNDWTASWQDRGRTQTVNAPSREEALGVAGVSPYPSIPMTEAMRKKLLEEGLPLFMNAPDSAAHMAAMQSLYDRLPERAFAPDKGRMLHGTTVDSIPGIRRDGLEPRAGAFVEKAYGGEYADSGMSLPELVYMAGADDPKRAMNAVRAQVAAKLGKSYHAVTPEDITEHGALVVTRPDPHSTWQMGDDQQSTNMAGESDHGGNYESAATAEPNDWYSYDRVDPTGILKGQSLKRFRERNGLFANSPDAAGIAALYHSLPERAFAPEEKDKKPRN